MYLGYFPKNDVNFLINMLFLYNEVYLDIIDFEFNTINNKYSRDEMKFIKRVSGSNRESLESEIEFHDCIFTNIPDSQLVADALVAVRLEPALLG